jgi:hypothetical protein
MRSNELEAILLAISDVQVAVDALGLDVERVLEILARTDPDQRSSQPPPWVNPAGHEGE